MRLQYCLIFTLLYLCCDIFPFSECACTLPSTFTGSWWDSRTNGAITISSLKVTTGWEITVNLGQYTSYTCIHSNASHWVFRSDVFVKQQFGGDYYAVFCFQYTMITNNSYYYYIRSNKEPILNDRRIFLVDVDSDSKYTTLAEYCNATEGPDAREFNVFVKASQQTTIHVTNFPDPLLGVFYYTVNNGTTTSCGGTGSIWDGCYYNNVIDRTTLKFNYTQCATRMLGSTNGLLYHVASVKYSSTHYTILINADGSDTKFTCIAVSQSGSTRSVSTNPGGCAEGQISTSQTNDSKSVLITMTEYETCLLTTTTSTTSTTTRPTTSTTTRPTITTRVSTTSNAGASTTSSDSNTTAAVVGAVLSILLLILIIIIAYLLYKKYKGTALITHKASVREQPPFDIKKPLPDNDFELSDHPMASSPSVENDMVIEPMTPTDKNDNPMKDLTSYSNPVQQPRPPVSSMWYKPSVPFHDEVKRNLTPLPTKPKLQNKDWNASHPLPPISGHL